MEENVKKSRFLGLIKKKKKKKGKNGWFSHQILLCAISRDGLGSI